MLLAMAFACEPDTGPGEQELSDDYRGSSREWAGLSERIDGTSRAGAFSVKDIDNSLVTALLSGQGAGAVLVVCLWMAVKAAGQSHSRYTESSTAIVNGGRLEIMLAAFGCICGAYICARICAGRFDNTALTSSEHAAEAALIRTVRPFALALTINAMCSTILFPRLLDAAPSKYGTAPDWLASDLTLLYCVADLAGRVFSQDFFVAFLGFHRFREVAFNAARIFYFN